MNIVVKERITSFQFIQVHCDHHFLTRLCYHQAGVLTGRKKKKHNGVSAFAQPKQEDTLFPGNDGTNGTNGNPRIRQRGSDIKQE